MFFCGAFAIIVKEPTQNVVVQNNNFKTTNSEGLVSGKGQWGQLSSASGESTSKMICMSGSWGAMAEGWLSWEC